MAPQVNAPGSPPDLGEGGVQGLGAQVVAADAQGRGRTQGAGVAEQRQGLSARRVINFLSGRKCTHSAQGECAALVMFFRRVNLVCV